MFGISASEDMDMVAQIKNEVRKLCTKGNVAAQISLNEHDATKHDNLSRMIYESERELKVRHVHVTYRVAICFCFWKILIVGCNLIVLDFKSKGSFKVSCN